MFKKSIALLAALFCAVVFCTGCEKKSAGGTSSSAAVEKSDGIDRTDKHAVIAAILEAVQKQDADALWNLTDPAERKDATLSSDELFALCDSVFNSGKPGELEVMLAMFKSKNADEMWANMPEEAKKRGKQPFAEPLNNFDKFKAMMTQQCMMMLSRRDGKYFVNVEQVVSFGAALSAARYRAQSANSLVNLKQIGLGVIMYMGDHKDLAPANFTDLLAGGYMGDTSAARIFIAPYDKKSVTSEDGKINSNNTSYVYLINNSVNSGKLGFDFPVAMEKPWILPGTAKQINVLFGDGHVESVQIDNVAKLSCQEALKKIIAQQGISSHALVELSLKKAAEADLNR